MRECVFRMRAGTLIALLLALCACSKNRDELRAIRDRMELQLAERKELAQNLSERRLEIEALDRELAEAIDAGVRVDDLPSMPDPTPPVLTPVPPPALPPASMWEGTECERLRRQIDDLHHRIAELEKAIGELNDVERHKREVQWKLRRVKDLRRASDQTNEAF